MPKKSLNFGARLLDKGKAAIRSLGRSSSKSTPSGSLVSTPSGSRTPSPCGSTVAFTDPAISPPGEEDVTTSAEPPINTHGSTSLAPAHDILAPPITDSLIARPADEGGITGTLEIPDPLGQPDTQESSGGSGPESQLLVIVPRIAISEPEQDNGHITDETAATPIDVVLNNIPTTSPAQPLQLIEGTPTLGASAQTAGTSTLEQGKAAASLHVLTTPTSANTGGASQIAIEKQPQAVNTPSLWEEAWKKLPEDVRTHFHAILKLDETNNKGSGAAKQLLTIAVDIRDICEKQKLIDTIDDGKRSRRIIVRDLADKLINWISKFVAVGDTLMQYDPGHAAIPWAIVRFILQSAILHKERMAEIVTNTEYLGRLMVRCVAYEELYLVPKSKPHNCSSLKLAVQELYWEILEFLVETAKHLNRKTPGRIMRAILEPESLGELLQKIKSREKLLAKELELTQRKDAEHNHRQLAQLLDDLEKPIQRVASDLQTCYQSVQAQTRRGILNWITNNEYQAPHNLALQGLLEDTGKWFFDRIEYKEWRSASASSILWLHGIPGAGKTKLTCQVIKTLRSTSPNEALCFFYCKRDGEASRRKPLTVLQAVIRQLSLCQPDGLPNEILIRYTEDGADGFPAGKSGVLRWEDCRALLLSLLNLYPQTTIIIDALDELDIDYESKHRHLLLELLNDVVLQCDSLVKIFVASRDDQDIVMELEKVPNLFIKATDNLKDIQRYIIREFETDKRFFRAPWSPELKNIVYAELCKKAGGMFQWVKLQLQFLVSMKVERDIRQKLGQAPKDLTAAYDQIYTLIEGEEEYGCEAAKCALMWVMCTAIPLTMEILLEATRYVTGSRDISAESLLELCRNLLTWDKSENSNVVQFAHLSVKEYLIAGKWTEAEAHGMAANACLTALIEKTHEHGLQRTQNQVTNPLEYADSYWLEHVSKGCDGQSRKIFKEALCSFLGSPTTPSPSYANWILGRQQAQVPMPKIEIMLWKGHHSEPPNPLFLVAACHFLLEFMEESWQEWECFDLRSRNKAGDSPLYIAASHGNSAVVIRLLANDTIDINVQSGGSGTLLFRAASQGHTKIVQQLLVHSVIDVNMNGTTGRGARRVTGTPLFVASLKGHAEIVQQLLAHSAVDANVKGKTAGGDTGIPLFVAASQGHAGIVQRLLAHSAIDVNMEGETVDGYTGTPLFVATHRGYSEIVQQLLAHSAIDVNMEGSTRAPGISMALMTGTPLFVATHRGYSEIVQQLLAHSAIDVNMKGEAYGDTGTSLFVAALKGHTEVVQQLLAHSAIDVNVKGGAYGATGTPLFVAAYKGHVGIVEQLLAHSAIDVNMKREIFGRDTGNPLFVAALEGHTEIVQQLLAHSAINVNITGGAYGDTRTPLFVAAYKGYTEIVQQLLAHSAIDVNMKGEIFSGDTGTPLFVAAYKGYIEIVQQLLAHSAIDVNMNGKAGRVTGTPLFVAALEGHTGVVQRLMVHSAIDVNMEGKAGRVPGTPLFVAALKGHTDIVQQLLTHSAIDVNMNGKAGRVTGTPLFVAAYKGHAGIVEQLVVHSTIDVNMKGETIDGDAATPVFVAALNGHTKIVQQLLAHSAIDVKVKGGAYGDTGTPLFVAALEGHTEIVQQLLAHSAIDVNITGGAYGDTGTPLFVAAYKGYTEIVQQLLAHSAIDVNIQGEIFSGDTGSPLFVAVLEGHTGVVQQLLTHSAIDVTSKGKAGGVPGTPLFVAALKEHAEIVQQLLAHGAIDINSSDNHFLSIADHRT